MGKAAVATTIAASTLSGAWTGKKNADEAYRASLPTLTADNLVSPDARESQGIGLALERTYKNTHVIERDSPYEMKYTDEDIKEFRSDTYHLKDEPMSKVRKLFKEQKRAERKLVDEQLERFGAVFGFGVQLSSGIVVNVYGSKYDRREETDDYRVKPRALDVLTNQVLQTAAKTDTYYKNDAQELAKRAKNGDMRFQIDMVMIAADNRCISGPKQGTETGHVPKRGVVADGSRYCRNNGVANRLQSYNRNTEVFMAIVDTGPLDVKQLFGENSELEEAHLDANEVFANIYAHELGHVLIGNFFENFHTESKPGDVGREHAMFVSPIQRSIYRYQRRIKKLPNVNGRHPIEFITPFLVQK